MDTQNIRCRAEDLKINILPMQNRRNIHSLFLADMFGGCNIGTGFVAHYNVLTASSYHPGDILLPISQFAGMWTCLCLLFCLNSCVCLTLC